MRARDLGILIGRLEPGPDNAITDVAGVRVGHETLIEGNSVRTGVTVVLPHDGHIGDDPVFAGSHRINGNGEMTGLHWVRESGLLASPVAITNTFSVGVVRDALAATGTTDGLPVVAETWDGPLNDIHGMHVTGDHLRAALAAASPGPVAEGNVGGGTGMICHGFKGGIGTASRRCEGGGFVVGALVQANHGRRERLRIDGLPVGETVGPERVPLPSDDPGWPPSGSIIIVVATDAPLLPHQCERLARRAGFGVARTGGMGENSSGDLVLAFATGNRGLKGAEATAPVVMLSDRVIDRLFAAVIDATEEAIVNALLRAETMTGHDGATAHALEPAVLSSAVQALRTR